MPGENMQKIKLLKLLEMLRTDTDEQNPMTTMQIIDRLGQMGITCDRRTLTRDVALLNDQGYEVMSVMEGHNKAYYVDDRSFSIPELKILIDAVQAASFITPKKTDQLTRKIAALGGSHQSEVLTGNVVTFNARKHSNESIYYVVDALSRALQRGRKVSFEYFYPNENHEKTYHHGRRRYIEEPLALVYINDNYYLLCFRHSDDPDNTTRTFRLDRMEQVQAEKEPVSPEAAAQRRDMPAEYTTQTFKMFNGPKETVTLQFSDDLINTVFDEFGEQTKMVRTGASTCVAEVTVRLSSTFWGWLFEFAGKMEVLSPQSVADAYRERARMISEK